METEEPVGEGEHVVAPGEGMSAIAEAHGLFWETLWNHPENSDLKRIRKNPEMLVPGDRVTVPPIREKVESCATRKVHRFRRKGVPVRVIYRVRDKKGRPFGHAPYRLQVGDHAYRGVTDAEGTIKEWVVPAAKTGELVVSIDRPPYPKELTWSLKIGHLWPIDTVTGVRQRLENLGYDCGQEPGLLSEPARAALSQFQDRSKLPISGTLDETTRGKLLEVHGS